MCFWMIPLAAVIGEWNSGKKFILSCSANGIVFTWLGNITGVHVTSENVLGKFFWLWKSDFSQQQQQQQVVVVVVVEKKA